MSDQEHNTPATDAVKALHRFLLGPEGEGDRSPERVSQEMQRAGVDVRKMSAQIRKQIRKRKIGYVWLRSARDEMHSWSSWRSRRPLPERLWSN